jgi:predicted PhzF superfamily epimerase YddE/YHI9
VRPRHARQRPRALGGGAARPRAEARIHTRSGLLTARRDGDWIELDFPTTPPQPAEAPPELLAGLRIEQVRYVGRSTFDYLVEVESEAQLRALDPNFSTLKQVETRGVMVTSRAEGSAFDFVSRFFGPAAGIDEDPVTGSAHCALGPYWQERLGKDRLLAYQASTRGGVVRVTLRGERIGLGGQAVTVIRGELV